jgi:hypothetical protein
MVEVASPIDEADHHACPGQWEVPRSATIRHGARRELRYPVVVGRPMLGTKHTWGLKALYLLVSTYVQNRVLAKTARRNVTEA